MSARRPVLADVARLAGVSHQTVSRVVNEQGAVREATRQRVELAISQLGYRGNSAARALVTRRSLTVGVISCDSSQYGTARTIFGIEDAARLAGYHVSLATLPEISHSALRAVLRHLSDARVDGIVLLAPVHALREALDRQRLDVPYVMAQTSDPASELSVVVDQEAGAGMATRHLLELGHLTVTHVAGPAEWDEAQARTRGWRAELEAWGRPTPPVLPAAWSAAAGYRAGRQIAEMAGCTAVFAASDQIALGVLRALHEAGRTVPGDVSIVGFDDIPEAGYFQVPLTTVRQDFNEVGRRCIERLLGVLGDRASPRRDPITPELLVRASTAPPRAARR